jgi:hypothetical protein
MTDTIHHANCAAGQYGSGDICSCGAESASGLTLPTRTEHHVRGEKIIRELEQVRIEILEDIDGGIECEGRDSQLTRWADEINSAISFISAEKP